MIQGLSKTRFGRILLPAIIFQSVVMGGAFATGREIVEYLAEFGALGIVSITVHIISLTIFGVIIYELSRMFNAYDYKTLVKISLEDSGRSSKFSTSYWRFYSYHHFSPLVES